jgi:phosphoribosylanthranilate isomerase
MKIKVCGMKNPDNIRNLVELPIDIIGLIFYEQSPRYAGSLAPEALSVVPPHIRKAGVFVNAGRDCILEKAEHYGLDIIQLHGDETPEFCRELRTGRYEIVKTFPISEKEDLSLCALYENSCDYFLFDTKTPQRGGSGRKFDWQVLSHYNTRTPYFLSGGIGEEDLLDSGFSDFCDSNPRLYAIDLNSRFETSPGIKDIAKLEAVLSRLNVK